MNADKNNKAIIMGVAAIVVLVLVGLIGYAAVNYFAKDSDNASTSGTSEAATNPTAQEIETKTTHSTTLPSDLPEDTPLFEGAKLLDASTTAMGDISKDYSLNFQTTSSPQDVFAYYKDAFNSNGWKTHIVRSEDTFNLIAASHDGKNLNANFSSPTNTSGGAETNYVVSISTMPTPVAVPVP